MYRNAVMRGQLLKEVHWAPNKLPNRRIRCLRLNWWDGPELIVLVVVRRVELTLGCKVWLEMRVEWPGKCWRRWTIGSWITWACLETALIINHDLHKSEQFIIMKNVYAFAERPGQAHSVQSIYQRSLSSMFVGKMKDFIHSLNNSFAFRHA